MNTLPLIAPLSDMRVRQSEIVEQAKKGPIDDYRIIYAIDDDVVQVEVIHVAKRTPKTYAGLS